MGERTWVSAVAVAGVALSAWLLVLVVVHAGRPEHDLPVSAIVIGVGGAVGSTIGWALIGRSGDGLLLAIALLGLLLVGGVATLLSIGVVLLLVGGGVAVAIGPAAAGRRLAGRPLPGRVAIAVGALVGLGLPVAALVATDGPVVRCHDGGASTSSSLFRSSRTMATESGSGTTSMSSGGRGSESTGTIVQGDRTYRYRCAGTELIEFEASDT